MPKANCDPYCLVSLARDLAFLWQTGAGANGPQASPVPAFYILSNILLGQGEQVVSRPQSNQMLQRIQGAFYSGLGERLLIGCERFISEQKRTLSRQGLERVSESGLRAFFFSALYEAVRFNSILGVPELTAPGRQRRKRAKRHGAAYYTPPALAYLAAHRALSAYFAGGRSAPNEEKPLPRICDPAMGTGLFLVAALDYLSRERPDLCRSFLTEQSLFGIDLDAITCGVAGACLSIAIGSQAADLSTNLLWEDGLLAKLPPFDVVLGNPPWDIAKITRTATQPNVPSRVNKARSAALKQSFCHQGEGDTSYYKLFLERSYQLLKDDGVAALLAPAAFCSDLGAAPLRRLLLDHSKLLSLDGFINEDNCFAIHPLFKYVLLCFKKGLSTEVIKTRFGLVAGKSTLLDTIDGDSAGVLNYLRSLVDVIGGASGVILEFGGQDDLDLFAALCQRYPRLSTFLRREGARFRREFDMTLDRSRFVTAKRAGKDHLKLIEGRTLGQFALDKKEARLFVSRADYRGRVPERVAKVGFVSVTSAYNTCSVIASYLPDLPVGNSVPTIVFARTHGENVQAIEQALYTAAVFNSFVFNWLVRLRLAGNNLNYYLLEDLPFPSGDAVAPNLFKSCVALSAFLSLSRDDFKDDLSLLARAPFYKQLLSAKMPGLAVRESCFALSDQCRLRVRVWLEVLVCEIYGLSPGQVDFILRDCDRSADVLARRRRLRRSGESLIERCEPDQRSFFRVDKGLAPHLRLSNMVKTTFSSLKIAHPDFDELFCASPDRAELALVLPPSVEGALEQRFLTAVGSCQ